MVDIKDHHKEDATFDNWSWSAHISLQRDDSNVSAHDLELQLHTIKILKEGWITKKGGYHGGRRNWKRRWFVLKHDCLFYYSSDAKSDKNLLGVMAVRGGRVGDMDDFDSDAVSSPVSAFQSDGQKVCRECKKAFGILRGQRRYHCRNCSYSFCKTCTTTAVATKNGDHENLRVCYSCFKNLGGSKKNKKIIGSSIHRTFPVISPKVESRIRRRPSTSNTQDLRTTSPPRRRKLTARKHMFMIENKQRKLWLATDTEAEKISWMHVLNAVIRRRSEEPRDMSPEAPKENPWEIDYSELTNMTKVASGAYGDIFRARLWGTDVAVKMLNPKKDAVDEEALADLKKEIAILSTLRHPNIILYIGACTKPPNICIITEWCDKGSLYDVIHDSQTQLDTKAIFQISMGIAQGLNYLHSLNQRIIHRDMKSHNILLDRNMYVKIGDFGLSHIMKKREKKQEDPIQNGEIDQADGSKTPPLPPPPPLHRSISMSQMGHYGIYGTPQWMAPEVMEGSKYNQKIDVYGYGIVLTELLSRQIPFKDRYNINTFDDVCDAVLDDGARPTIPEWSEEIFGTLVDVCLDRDPSARPSFMQIILKLNEMNGKGAKDCFIEYDIPRITETLSSEDPKFQERACVEIANLGQSRYNLNEAGESYFDMVDDEYVKEWLLRLTQLLCSELTSVQFQAAKALKTLLSTTNPTKRVEWREYIFNEGGIMELMNLLSGGCNQKVKDEAARILSMLTDALLSDEMIFVGLDPKGLKRLEDILCEEIGQMKREMTENEVKMRQKELLAKNLKITQQKARRETRVKTGRTRSRTAGSEEESAQYSNRISRFSTNPEMPTTQNSLEQAKGVLRIRNQFPMSPHRLSPKSSRSLSPLSEGLSASESKTSEAPSIDIHVSSEAPSIDIPAFSSSSIGTPPQCGRNSPSNKEPKLPIVTKLPPEFEEWFGAPIKHHGYCWQWGFVDERWSQAYLILFGSELRVYESADDDPEDPVAVFYMRTSSGIPQTVASGQMLGKQFCFAIDNEETKFAFSCRNQRDMSSWADRINPGAGTLANVEFLDEYTQRDEQKEEGLTVLQELPVIEELPESFAEFFATVDHFGCLLKQEDGPNSWLPVFALLSGRELRYYESPEEDPQFPFGMVYLFDSDDLPIKVTVLNDVADSDNASLVVDGVTFRAATTQERDIWAARLGRTTGEELSLTDLCTNSRHSVASRITYAENKQTKHSRKQPEHPLSDVDLAALNRLAMDIRKGREVTFGGSADMKLVKSFDSKDTDPRFVARFGQHSCHGYLMKRGRVVRSWKLRYFYYFGNEMHYFRSHKDSPDHALGVIYTHTNSGNPFRVKNSKSHRFGFIIENPSRKWHLCAQDVKSFNLWMEAFAKPVTLPKLRGGFS